MLGTMKSLFLIVAFMQCTFGYCVFDNETSHSPLFTNYKYLRMAKPTDQYKETPVVRSAKPTDQYKETPVVKSTINKFIN